MTSARTTIKTVAAVLLAFAVGGPLAAQADDRIPLPGKTLFPEGIAADAKGGLYIGSLTEGRIIYLEPETHRPRVFQPDGAHGLMSIGGLIISPDGGTLYACNSELPVATHKGASRPGLVAFDIGTGALINRWDFPGGGLCNDLTQAADGTILATDSYRPRILSLKPGAKTLSQWVTDDRFTGEGFNLNGIAWTPQGVFVVKYNSNQLFRIDMAPDGGAGAVTLVELSRPLGGPDGIKPLAPGELLVVEGHGRLSKITLDGLHGTIETLREGLDVPTTAAVVGDTAYVVEAQLDHLPLPGMEDNRPAPFSVAPVRLR